MSKKKGYFGGDGKGTLVATGAIPMDIVEQQPSTSSGVVAEPLATVVAQGSEINAFIFILEEIWDMILEFVGDSKSVHNVFLANPPFRDTFQSKISIWLFDQVFPLVLPFLSRKDVRTCTHVCKTWRRVVSHFVEDHPSRRPYNERAGNTQSKYFFSFITHPEPVKDLEVQFKTLESLETLLRIGPKHMNPFIGRSVSFHYLSSVSSNDEVAKFAHHAALLLEEYGKYIWYFQIFRHPELESAQNFFDRLKLSLSLLPNLRSLHVISTGGMDECEPVPGGTQLPPLARLESLTLENIQWNWPSTTYLPREILTALLRSYVRQQLGFLCLPLLDVNRMDWICDVIRDVDFTGLTELQLVNVDRYAHSDLTRTFLSSLPKVGLQKIQFVGAEIDGTLLQNLFGVRVNVLDFDRTPFSLGNYCNKECVKARKCTVWDGVAINLPHVHTLCINNQQLSDSYKFLGKIPSLQILELECSLGELVGSYEEKMEDMRRRRVKMMKRFGCHYCEISEELSKWVAQESTVDESLIWNLLTGLQTLKVSYFFQRKDAERNDEMVSMKRIFTHCRKNFVH